MRDVGGGDTRLSSITALQTHWTVLGVTAIKAVFQDSTAFVACASNTNQESQRFGSALAWHFAGHVPGFLDRSRATCLLRGWKRQCYWSSTQGASDAYGFPETGAGGGEVHAAVRTGRQLNVDTPKLPSSMLFNSHIGCAGLNRNA